jgi:hypothetical protein
MNRKIALAALACVLASPALAQTTTATGIGVGTSEANSASGAIAVNRGNGNSSSSLTVVNPANTTSTATVNQTVSGTTTQNVNSRVSGTTTLKSAPAVVAPGLAAAGLETCLGSASGTVSAIGFGIGGGSTYADEGCQARLDSRTLYAYGLKAAAVARLCQRTDIWRAMPDMCAQYWPQGVPYPNGIVIAAPVGRAAVVMSTENSMRVVDGRDGVEKDCLNYNAARQKCLQWAGEPPRGPRRHQVAAITPTKPMGAPKVAKPKPPKLPSVITDGPKPEPTKQETPKPDDSTAEKKS